MNQLGITIALFLSPSGIFSQNLPNIFASTPKQLLDAKTLAAYPKNTWLENLVVGQNGALYVTNYPEGKVFKIAADGKKEVYASIDGKIAGIALYHKNQFLVTGWDKQGKPAIFKIDDKLSVIKLLNIDGGMFPNGIVHLHSDKYLVADSYAGCIWQYDAASNKATVWLKDKLLERSSSKSQYPAANGLKMYNGNLYVSNTEKQTLIKVPISAFKPGVPLLFIDKVNIDDFTFDGSGNIYAATNVYNGVIKITPDKNITIVADLSSGVAGSTSVVIAKNRVGASVLYVATNGGMAVPPPTGVEEGKIIELSLRK
jgi:sugar lactone lactonase YvrE